MNIITTFDYISTMYGLPLYSDKTSISGTNMFGISGYKWRKVN